MTGGGPSVNWATYSLNSLSSLFLSGALNSASKTNTMFTSAFGDPLTDFCFGSTLYEVSLSCGPRVGCLHPFPLFLLLLGWVLDASDSVGVPPLPA